MTLDSIEVQSAEKIEDKKLILVTFIGISKLKINDYQNFNYTVLEPVET